MEEEREVVVTPGEVLGKASDLKAGRGAYVSPHNRTLYASLTGFRRILSPPPNSPDQVLLLFFHFLRPLWASLPVWFLRKFQPPCMNLYLIILVIS